MGTEYDVSIIGAGAMGHGLAVHIALSGHRPTLVDHRQRNLDDAREQITRVVEFLREQQLTERSASDVLNAISFTLDLESGVESADLVIETISENRTAKQELFTKLVRMAPDEAILSSNTSSIPITEIATAVPDHADRLVGCHWWFPPYLLTPVEVIEGERTSERTVTRLETFLDSVDRTPIHVRRDVPGFVWNRVQFAIVRECLHIVESGVASVEDVNTAIRDGYAVRTAAIGPFETLDIAGLELFATIAEELYPELADDDEPQPLLEEHIAAGRTGVDAGAGLLEYDSDEAAVTLSRDRKVAAIRQALDQLSEQ